MPLGPSEQTERTIVPHTVEEAYEVADAALAGDADALSVASSATFSSRSTSSRCSLEERGEAISSPSRADVHAKLVRRHPHVFGDADARTPGRVQERWEALQTEQEGREGIFHDVPECAAGAAPGAQGAAQRSHGRATTGRTSPGRCAQVRESCGELEDGDRSATDMPAPETEPDADVDHELGDLLFTVVNVARRLERRSRARAACDDAALHGRASRLAADLAARRGRRLDDASSSTHQDAYYERAKEELA